VDRGTVEDPLIGIYAFTILFQFMLVAAYIRRSASSILANALGAICNNTVVESPWMDQHGSYLRISFSVTVLFNHMVYCKLGSQSSWCMQMEEEVEHSADAQNP